MTREEKAADLCVRKRELLVAELLGNLIEFGEGEVLTALQDATAEMEKWRSEYAPHHVPNFIKLKALSGGLTERTDQP